MREVRRRVAAVLLAAPVIGLPATAAPPAQPLSEICPDLLAARVALPRELQDVLEQLQSAVRARDAGRARQLIAGDARFDFGDQLTIEDLGLTDPSAPAWSGPCSRCFSVGEAGRWTCLRSAPTCDWWRFRPGGRSISRWPSVDWRACALPHSMIVCASC